MKCKNCKHYHHDWCSKVHDDPYPDMERNCKHYVVATNADRIRAMSDEELAEVLDGSICPQGYNQLGECEASKEICHDCWLDWLKQEAADG